MAIVDIPSISSSQTIRPLFLLLSFSDSAYSTTDFDNYPSFAFSDVPWQMDNTLADYYREVSGDQLRIKGDSTSVHFVDMSAGAHSYEYYVNGKSGVGAYPRNAQGMVEDALNLANFDVDFSDFDNDGPDGIPRSSGSVDDDGTVDSLVVVHAGPAAEYFTSPTSDNHMVSHYWYFTDVARNHDGVDVLDWAMVPERDPDSTDGSFDRQTIGTYQQTLGTVAHEFGHILGLPDLYDKDLSSYGLGHWGLMSYGTYGTMTFSNTYLPTQSSWDRPGYPSAWSRVQLGWIDPVAVHADTLFSIWRAEDPPPLNYPQVVKIWTSNSWTPLSPWTPSEYFLFEHRQSASGTYDYGPSVGFNGDGEGAVLLYHVDETVPDNDDESRKMVDLEEFGNYNLDNKVNFGEFGNFWRQGSDSFYWWEPWGSGSTPDTRDNSGMDTGLVILNGFGPVSDDDLSDYLMTVDIVNQPNFTKNTMGYTGTDRAGPFTVASGTFDDGGSDPWVQAGRPVSINLTIKHSGMPNTAQGVSGLLLEDPSYFSVISDTVAYGDLTPLASSAGSGSSYIVQFNYSSVAFTWVPVNVQFKDANDNLSESTFSLPLINHPRGWRYVNLFGDQRPIPGNAVRNGT
jgi:M6 family metalloprotease-like protein